jgi:hypothetical protein
MDGRLFFHAISIALSWALLSDVHLEAELASGSLYFPRLSELDHLESELWDPVTENAIPQMR